MSLRVSATVWPVMVMQSPCSRPALSRVFMTCGMPPARCRSTARYLPLGFRLHSTGVFWRTRSKSSIDHSTPAAWAIARKCSTALVEPPMAMTTATAFSIDFRVTMSRGFRSFLMASISTVADSLAEFTFSSCGFAMVLEKGREMPSASNADDMVLAVYMPPHEPGPGMARRSISSRSSSLRRPAAFSPTASNTLTMLRSLPLVMARQNGAAIDKNGGHIGAQHAHQAARHVLVAAADDHHAVHPLALHAGLDAVGDDFPADQGVLHAFGAHRHAVRNGRGAEHLGVAARLLNRRHGRIGQ